MDIQTIQTKNLNPAAYNPRQDLQPGTEEYETLRKSIIEFGYIDPIIWNKRTGNIVGGHQRFKILKEEGRKEIEVSVVDLDDNQERALNLMLNKSGGDWEHEKLAALLDHLQKQDYNLELTGFNDAEIEDLLNDYYDEQPITDEDLEDFDPDQEAELIIEPYTKTGDIWHLGPHRLIVGDSLQPETWDELMREQQAHMVFTDPPYNVAVNTGDLEDLKRRNRRTDGKLVENDSMSNAAFYEFLLETFKRHLEHTTKGGPIYICHADSEGLNFRKAMKEAGWEQKQTLIWVKNAIVMGRQDYHWQHEPILYGWKPGAAHRWFGERDKSTVYDEQLDLRKLDKKELIAEIKRMRNEINTTIFQTDKPSRSEDHPTMKPLTMIRHYIKNSTTRGNLLIDGFLGSGSSLIAADQLGRVCFGAEIDPNYAQVIVERYCRYKETNESVFVERNGSRLTYDEAIQEREAVS